MNMIAPKPAKGSPGAQTRLSSVAMAIRLLKVFSEGEAEIGVSALAARLKVAKSTVHRLAVTLVSEGMLEQNPENEKYRLGIALFGLGALVRRRMSLSNEARPFLFDLRETTDETVLLGILSQSEVMYVYNLESKQAIRMRSDIGVRKPAFCTAVGRSILAFQPPEVIEEVLAGPLPARTGKTITDPARLRTVLEDIRRHGYDVEDEESEAGMRCVAAPVRDSSGHVVGALGIAGPTQRLTVRSLVRLSAPLVRTCEAISNRLGYHPGSAF